MFYNQIIELEGNPGSLIPDLYFLNLYFLFESAIDIQYAFQLPLEVLLFS